MFLPITKAAETINAVRTLAQGEGWQNDESGELDNVPDLEDD